MAAAATMVGGLLVKRPVVVVKNKVLAFKPNYVRHARKISIVFGDDKSAGVKGQHHTCRIDETTLVIISAGVLLRGQSNVRRVLSLTVFYSISARDKNCVITKSHPIAITVTLRDVEEIGKSLIDCIQHVRAGRGSRQYGHATRG